jgi:hypothetical protein
LSKSDYLQDQFEDADLLLPYRRAENANAKFDDSFVEVLKNKESSKLFSNMRTLFHFCVSISPMMALQTQQFLSVRRDQVIAVSVMPSSKYYLIDDVDLDRLLFVSATPLRST